MREDYSGPIGRNNTDNITKSRVTVYLGSDYYIERTETDSKTVYNTFLQIAYVMAVYLGCSIISFAEIIYYLTEYFVHRKKKRGANQVAPAP
jgi:hypothetical protein